MFYMPNGQVPLSGEAIVAPGYLFTAESQAAVRTKGDTAAGVLPSTGTANDIFVGFVVAAGSAAPFREPFANKVQDLKVSDTGSVTLDRAPIAGQIFAVDLNTGAPVDLAAATINGKTITGLDNGAELHFVYKYALTVLEATALQGNTEPGGPAGAQVNQIGLYKRGQVWVSEFDASKDWTKATAIKLGANGQLTDQTGSGVEIKGFVIEAPSTEKPFLGIEFDAL